MQFVLYYTQQISDLAEQVASSCHSGEMVSAVASQKEEKQFDHRPGAFLFGVCMLLVCL